MRNIRTDRRLALTLFLVAATLAAPAVARAHCDRLDGPVAEPAREALGSGRFELLQIWVAEPQEAELRDAFEMALRARDDGPEARKLAERYTIETAVRLHRQAEGMTYEGVAPAGMELPKDIRLADQVLEAGDVEPILTLLSHEVHQKVSELYERARAARAHRHESVQAGREWVDAYVRYVVFVHGLQQTIESGPEHGVGHAG